MKKTSGWYTFSDGYNCWVHGLSSREKQYMEHKHGKIVSFIPD